jgi:hypothetical protein
VSGRRARVVGNGLAEVVDRFREARRIEPIELVAAEQVKPVGIWVLDFSLVYLLPLSRTQFHSQLVRNVADDILLHHRDIGGAFADLFAPNLTVIGGVHELSESSSSQWFWHDSDSCSDDPHELYNFFAASGDRIVREMSRSATTMTADLIQLFSSRLIIPISFG